MLKFFNTAHNKVCDLQKSYIFLNVLLNTLEIFNWIKYMVNECCFYNTLFIDLTSIKN